MKVNPYSAALDGLALPDPVAAFFDFCREREAIRVRRESGAPAPWSADPIFQQGRFLNVFREDDRGSKAVRRFVEPTRHDLPRLVQAVFFARWCNRQSTLDATRVEQLGDAQSLRHALQMLPDQPWCNVTAYPVEPVRFNGRLYSRLETATSLFGELRAPLTNAITQSGGDATVATKAVNALLGMSNDFPIFMAIIDLADLRPDIIDPASPVPTGIGAVAFLDRLQHDLGCEDHHQASLQMMALQREHWPEAKRPFQPIDIEYLACECRKYFSYVNGTKAFVGKNRFREGGAAGLLFDIDCSADRSDTQIHVLAGGPGSGKSTVATALRQAGYRVLPETARQRLNAGVARGLSAAELRADPIAWQQENLRLDHALFDALSPGELIFTDTSVVEDLVYCARAGIEVGPRLQAWLRAKRYKRVFFLEPLKLYEATPLRRESQALARRLSAEVLARYRDFGYDPVLVPAAPLEERVARIRSHLDG